MATQAPTQVCISIDTEFSIAGHFQRPEEYAPLAEPVVYGSVNGRDEGLGFMLETFDRFDITASFFVECANYYYFGDEPMRTVVQRLQAAGQDVQLHIHPIWLSFSDDHTFPKNDDCVGRDFDGLRRAFAACIEVFTRWSGRRPLAIRTGSLRADDNVYRVMADLDVPMSSNLALGIYQPQEPWLRRDSGRHRVHGVTELPVLTYQDMNIAGRRHLKSLQVTSCSWPEMKHLLWRARRAGIENIVILTHPFEFIKKADFRYSRLTRNRVNQGRLERLCQFLAEHPEEFAAADFTSHRAQWQASEASHPRVATPTAYAVGRKLHNKLNDTIWSY